MMQIGGGESKRRRHLNSRRTLLEAKLVQLLHKMGALRAVKGGNKGAGVRTFSLQFRNISSWKIWTMYRTQERYIDLGNELFPGIC